MAFKGLFIGIDRYASPGVNWLTCSGRDAMALHALFTDTLGGETVLLVDEQATLAALLFTPYCAGSIRKTAPGFSSVST